MQDENLSAAHVSVSGSSNVVAGRDVIQIITERPKFTVVVQRDDGHITDGQAAILKRMVHEIVEHALKAGARLTYQEVWRALNAEIRVPSYRLTPAARFHRAETFLAEWRDRLAGVDV